MEIEKDPSNDQKLKDYFKPVASVLEGLNTHEKVRSKSSHRIRYEAEVEILRKKLGDLESIRNQLGLSQRKICQLLFVDPSAWTRWTKGGDAPPHIYRALQWYLALQDKYPALDVNFWLSTVPRANPSLEMRSTAVELAEQEIRSLKKQMKMLMIANFCTSLLVIGLLLRILL